MILKWLQNCCFELHNIKGYTTGQQISPTSFTRSEKYLRTAQNKTFLVPQRNIDFKVPQRNIDFKENTII